MRSPLLFVFLFVQISSTFAAAFHNPYGKWPVPPGPGDKLIHGLLAAEARALTTNSLAAIHSIEDWERNKPGYRAQLFEMLGLEPLPPRSELHSTTTGRIEDSEFVVEKLHFQSLPGLYVTANLYLPRAASKPVPAILYLCGHSQNKTNGVSFGNKVGYQHHGSWFARHGYACLVVDTVQLGEIEGIHHGTHREGMWWWNSRGYTSAGVEAWNCIRALDYLESRKEIDPHRIGVTGRSGGGAYSWWIAALDDRIKAACPVAGITDLENHVVDGTVEGHCDCMFHINTYRWDFDQVAALVAPRPLLICNTDKDTIFPLDGVVRIHEKVRRIYDLHKATDRLGLLVTEGPHKDSQELQLPVLRWFNRFLKNDASPIQNVAAPFYSGQQLKVFDQLPKNEITSTCHEHFIQPVSDPSTPTTVALIDLIRKKSFGGWPTNTPPAAAFQASRTADSETGLQLSIFDFESQPGLPLRFYVATASGARVDRWIFETADQDQWNHKMESLAAAFKPQLKLELPWTTSNRPKDTGALTAELRAMAASLRDTKSGWIMLAPRGVGLTALSTNSRFMIQTRRRFMLVGQTLAGMQVWDTIRGIQSARSLPEVATLPIELSAPSSMTEIACFATIMGAKVDQLKLVHSPRQDRFAPDFLNWSRLASPDQLMALARSKCLVTIPETK